jgi:hypothetical protein
MSSTPISPPPAEGPRNGDQPAYVSNGMIGLPARIKARHGDVRAELTWL